MGKDSKPKDAKGKGKAGSSGGDDAGGKGGKGKGGKSADGLGTCTYVKARHVLCEKQGKINEAYKKLQDGWLDSGDKVPPAEFAKDHKVMALKIGGGIVLKLILE
uniref:peptidylprolyl isomerase n=1 Tax=Setaria italica TaxID=4555 RepID=K3ZYB8_SETIT